MCGQLVDDERDDREVGRDPFHPFLRLYSDSTTTHLTLPIRDSRHQRVITFYSGSEPQSLPKVPFHHEFDSNSYSSSIGPVLL